MATGTRPQSAIVDLFHPDRPGWIPEWVGDDWDPHPYAYQTREELMPAGNEHSLYIQILAEMLTAVLQRQGLRRFIDVFIFYRDWEGRKQRIAPDLLIAPGPELAPKQGVHSYDLDIEPVPLCVVEIISPRSRKADTQSKGLFYAALGIREYLLLDVEDEDEQLLDPIGISLWRLENELPIPVEPDEEGYLTLEMIGVRLRADRRRLVAQDMATGELLRTNEELLAALAATELARQEAERARQEAEQRAVAEAAARQQLEAELERLRAELARRQGPDQV